MTGAPLTPEAFTDLLGRQDWAALAHSRVRGRINLAGKQFAHSVILRGITFLGDVDFSDCGFEGSVSFEDCDFLRNLVLDNSEIDGTLSLRGAVVRGGASYNGRRFPRQYPLRAVGLVVRGDLTLDLIEVTAARPDAEDSQFDGGACFRNAVIEGNLCARGAVFDGELVIEGAVISGGLKLGSVYDPAQDAVAQGYFRGGLDARDIRVAGRSYLRGFVCGGDAQFWGSTFESSLFVDCLHWPLRTSDDQKRKTTTYRSDIAGDLNFFPATVKGHLELKSVRVGGLLSCGGSFGSVQAVYDRGRNDQEAELVPCSIGALAMQGCEIAASVQLNGLRITGHPTYGGVWIAATKIGASLRFWSQAMLSTGSGPSDWNPDPIDTHAFINGSLTIEGDTHVGGIIDLTNVLVDGDIAVRDSQVTSDLRFASNVSLLNDPHFGREEYHLARGTRAYCGARAKSLDLTMLTCGGNVDLTGLGIDEITARNLDVRGSLSFQLVHNCETRLFRDPPVGGNYCATEIPVGKNSHGTERHAAYCRVKGFADFANLKATSLRVSAHTFDTLPAELGPAEPRGAKRKGLRLAGARVGEFQVARIWPGERTSSGILVEDAPRHQNFFPAPIEIRDMEVGFWKLGDEERPRAERFKRLLRNDLSFQRSSYRAIETHLRDQGHDRDADQVYQAMKEDREAERRRDARRALRERRPARILSLAVAWLLLGLFVILCLAAALPSGAARQSPAVVQHLRAASDAVLGWLGIAWLVPFLVVASFFSRSRYYAYRFLLGFGTQPLVLFVPILALWLAMLPAYFDPANFQPSLAALAKTVDPPAPDAVPSEDAWTALTAIFVSFDYHVPMLNLMMRGDWDLRDSGGLAWGLDLPRGRATVPSAVFGRITPEDWGALMIACNWILWPLVLTFIVRKAVRGSGD